MEDDVPEETKSRRLREVIETFRRSITEKNEVEEMNRLHVVLVDGLSSRTRKQQQRRLRQLQEQVENGQEQDFLLDEIVPELTGRTDTNKRCVFPERRVYASACSPPIAEGIAQWRREWDAGAQQRQLLRPPPPSILECPPLSGYRLDQSAEGVELKPGDYAVVRVHRTGTQTLLVEPLARTTIAEAASLGLL
jgi:hypothetical protein